MVNDNQFDNFNSVVERGIEDEHADIKLNFDFVTGTSTHAKHRIVSIDVGFVDR